MSDDVWKVQRDRHHPDSFDPMRCAAPGCGDSWPCPYRLQAERELTGRHWPGRVLTTV